MKYLLLLLLLIPISANAGYANTNFWGWSGYADSFGPVHIWTYKLYNNYNCTLLERYDEYNLDVRVIKKTFKVYKDEWTMNRVYCKVKNYQCNCIYK